MIIIVNYIIITIESEGMCIPVNITVLGNNGPYPAAGGACSGYLIRDGATNLLIDCGSGVISNLQKFVNLEDINAIILTHLHSDHISDMLVLKYAVQIKNMRGTFDKAPVNVYLSPEPAEVFAGLKAEGIYDLKPVDENAILSIGDLKIKFKRMKHPYLCYAVSIESKGRRFVFSGDTSMCDEIVEFAKGSDLLMLDSGLLSREKKNNNAVHLTAEECGIIAKQSGAKRLLLTHFWPEHDKNELLGEARRNFEAVELAELLATYEI